MSSTSYGAMLNWASCVLCPYFGLGNTISNKWNNVAAETCSLLNYEDVVYARLCVNNLNIKL